jgi:hypothetical protein
MRAPVIFLSDGTDPSTSTNRAPAITGTSITGTATQGQTLTAVDGTITGTPTPTITRQWKRSGVAVSGATGSTYQLTLADVGSTITQTVTAMNVVSSANATSSATAVVAASGSPFGILDFSDFTNSAHVATIGA